MFLADGELLIEISQYPHWFLAQSCMLIVGFRVFQGVQCEDVFTRGPTYRIGV